MKHLIKLTILTALFAVALNSCGGGGDDDPVTPKPPTPSPTDAAITIKAIGGLTAPVAGATPVTAVTATDQYSGTVAWLPAATAFAYSTAYTATVTLTPKAGYTLTGVAANFFTAAGATSANNTANSGKITVVFPKTADESSGNNSPLAGTVWSKFPDLVEMNYSYSSISQKLGGIEKIIPLNRLYANSWVFNPDGTFAWTLRWLYNYGTAYETGGINITMGKYKVLSDTQFKLTNMSTIQTMGQSFGDAGNLTAVNGEIMCEYKFFTDENGNGISIKMEGVGVILTGTVLGHYDNTWDSFWKRQY